MILIEVKDEEVLVKDGKCFSDDKGLEKLMNRFIDLNPPISQEPNYDKAIAERCIEEFGGKIIEDYYVPNTEIIQREGVYY